MTPILHISRNPNPRLAAASARFMDAPVEVAFAAPLAPGEDVRFRPLNPNLRLPILEEAGGSLWECDAVVCRMAMLAVSDFWPMDARLPEVIRWISWGKENFVRGCDMVQFEFGTKQRYDLGEVDAAAVAEGMEVVRASAALLETVLSGRAWLAGEAVTYADFRMATFLPFDDVMHLPLGDYPHVSAWNARLMALPAWADPFAGLDIPALPPVRR